MQQPSTTTRKAIIVGCGIAGPVVAMALQRAGIDAEVYEARDAGQDEAGAFLNLAPNGVKVLATLGIDIESAADGFPVSGIILRNAAGRRIGVLDSRDERERYGARSVVLKRGRLHRALWEAARERGIPLAFGKRLTDIDTTADGGVIARFEDGTTASGDLVIGCDGIHSRTRELILPDAPRPVYTGIVDCGGFAHPSPSLPSSGAMRMTFGRRAFFGYLAKPDGEVYWFSNVAWPSEPARGELAAIPNEEWRLRLEELHGNDPAPVPDILRSIDGDIGRWPIYDIPFLPTWHRGRVVLPDVRRTPPRRTSGRGRRWRWRTRSYWRSACATSPMCRGRSRRTRGCAKGGWRS